MVKFIKKYYHLAVIICVFAGAGCSSADNAPTDNPEKASINEAQQVNSESAPTATIERNIDVPEPRQKKEEKQQTLSDGSQYVEMKDAYGNKVEYRYFESDSPVKYISMETLSDGTVTMYVKARNGAKKSVNASMFDNPWQNSAREIASRAGIYSTITGNQIVSRQPQPSAQPVRRIIKATPQQEIKSPEAPVNESRAALKPE